MKPSVHTYTFIGGLAGLAALTGLIAYEGYSEILQSLERAGWGLLWLVPFHLLPLALDAEGWLTLLRARDPKRYATRPFLLWIALVREAVSRLLPVASIGGEIVGIRLVTLRPISGAAVTASVILEVLLTMVNQSLFTIIGLGLLVIIVEQPPLLNTLLGAVAISLPLPLLSIALLRYGSPFTSIAVLAERTIGNRFGLTTLVEDAAILDCEIRRLCKRRSRLAFALSWQLAGMFVGAFETWYALRLFGHPVTPAGAIVLESLCLAVRHLFFFLPGALGVQETALVVIGAVIGLPPEAAIALSLAKRFREVMIGLPALASWQWAELRQAPRKLRGRHAPVAAE